MIGRKRLVCAGTRWSSGSTCDVRSENNKPLGGLAEQVAPAALGGVLEPNSTTSHDVTDGMRAAYETLDI